MTALNGLSVFDICLSFYRDKAEVFLCYQITNKKDENEKDCIRFANIWAHSCAAIVCRIGNESRKPVIRGDQK